jgi:hypothetical protein
MMGDRVASNSPKPANADVKYRIIKVLQTGRRFHFAGADAPEAQCRN